MKKIILLISVLQSVAFAQNLNPASDQIEPSLLFSRTQKFDHEGVELYNSNLDLKEHKHLGLGVMIGGAAGMVGINGEMNIEPSEAAVVGMGFGSGYSSFNVAWKHNFIGNYISPYTKVGYSKWFNTSGTTNAASNSDILKRVLTEQEIKDNRFSADFLTGSLGLEYNQLEGELSGVNLFGEVAMLSEINKSTYIPTGAVGIIYFY